MLEGAVREKVIACTLGLILIGLGVGISPASQAGLKFTPESTSDAATESSEDGLTVTVKTIDPVTKKEIPPEQLAPQSTNAETATASQPASKPVQATPQSEEDRAAETERVQEADTTPPPSPSSGTRMLAISDGYKELQLRWDARLGGERPDGFTAVISRRLDMATVAAGYTMSDSYGRNDAWVVALDDEGKQLWQTSIGGAQDDRAAAIADFSNGSLVIVGDTASEMDDKLAGLVVKLSASGDIVWKKALTGSGDIFLHAVAVVADDNLLVAGTTGMAAYVAELRSDGSLLWEKELAEGPDVIRALGFLPNGHIVVVGDRTDMFERQASASIISPSGAVQWSQEYGSDGDSAFYDVQVLSDGSILAVGETLSETRSEQGWLVNVTKSEEDAWSKRYGGPGIDRLSGITVLSDQTVVLVGQTDVGREVAANSWVLRVSQTGDLIKAMALGEEYADGLAQIAARPDGSFSTVGFVKTDYDSSKDAYVALLGMPKQAEEQLVYARHDGPTIFVPGGGALVTESSTIEVLGNIVHDRPVRALYVDGKQAEILPNGAFLKQIIVPKGQSSIEVEAVDDRGYLGSTTISVMRTEKGTLAPTDIASLIGEISFGEYHALVIGNDSYTGDIPTLKTAVNDARAIADVLQKDYGFKVDLLVDATRKQILAALEKKSNTLGSDDNLLVYYAGHGYYDEDVDLGYWLPIGAQQESKEEWIRNSTITDTIKQMNAKHVLLVADSCFSGTLLRSVDVKRTGRFYEEMANRSARLVMTSGGIEPVMDGGGDGHSVFARNFLRKLRSSEGIVDGTSLYQSVREPVVMTSEQVPQYSNIRFIDSDGGDFLFVRRSSAQ